MRYSEKLRALTVICCALALAVAAGSLLSPGSRSARASRGNLIAAPVGAVEGVEISGKADSLRFVKYSGSWALDSGSRRLPARAERVDSFLDAVRSVRVMEEVSRSRSSWESYGLDDASCRRVRLLGSDGNPLADFRVGSFSPNGADVYIRKEGDERCYRIASSSATRLPADRKSWLDLRVFGDPVPTEDVQRIRVSGAVQFRDGSSYKAEYAITRSASKGWVSDQIPGLDPPSADRFVRAVMNAEAEDFAQGSALPPSEAGLRLELELGGGAVRTLRISARSDAEDRYRASLTGSGRVVSIAAWTLKDLLKTPGDLAFTAP